MDDHDQTWQRRIVELYANVEELYEHVDITVRFFAPWSRSAVIRFSGIPQSPKPDTMIDAPSGMSRTASAALFTTFFMGSPRAAPGRVDDSRGAEAPCRHEGGGVGVGVVEGRGEGGGTGMPDGRSLTPTRVASVWARVLTS